MGDDEAEFEAETKAIRAEASRTVDSSVQSLERSVRLANEARNAGAQTLHDLDEQNGLARLLCCTAHLADVVAPATDQLRRIQRNVERENELVAEVHRDLGRLERFFPFMRAKKRLTAEAKALKAAAKKDKKSKGGETVATDAKDSDQPASSSSSSSSSPLPASSPGPRGKSPPNQRAELMSSSAAGDRPPTVPLGTLVFADDAREDRIDSSLDSLSAALRDMRGQAETISTTLDKQNRVLEDMAATVGDDSTELKRINKHLGRF